jgi:Yip1 domain
MARKISHYFYRFIVNPASATEEISQDKSGLWVGLWWVIIFCVCYSVTVLIFYLLGHTPASKPFLTIPLEKWYLVQTFTTLPVGLAGFLSYSGLAYILCKLAKGQGSFDQTFSSQAFTIHIPTFIFMWIPETFLALILIANGIYTFPWPDWVENLRIFVFPFAWIFVISTIALSKIHRIPWWKSLIIILVSFIPTAGIMAVFIR